MMYELLFHFSLDFIFVMPLSSHWKCCWSGKSSERMRGTKTSNDRGISFASQTVITIKARKNSELCPQTNENWKFTWKWNVRQRLHQSWSFPAVFEFQLTSFLLLISLILVNANMTSMSNNYWIAMHMLIILRFHIIFRRNNFCV